MANIIFGFIYIFLWNLWVFFLFHSFRVTSILRTALPFLPLNTKCQPSWRGAKSLLCIADVDLDRRRVTDRLVQAAFQSSAQMTRIWDKVAAGLSDAGNRVKRCVCASLRWAPPGYFPSKEGGELIQMYEEITLCFLRLTDFNLTAEQAEESTAAGSPGASRTRANGFWWGWWVEGQKIQQPVTRPGPEVGNVGAAFGGRGIPAAAESGRLWDWGWSVTTT